MRLDERRTTFNPATCTAADHRTDCGVIRFLIVRLDNTDLADTARRDNRIKTDHAIRSFQHQCHSRHYSLYDRPLGTLGHGMDIDCFRDSRVSSRHLPLAPNDTSLAIRHATRPDPMLNGWRNRVYPHMPLSNRGRSSSGSSETNSFRPSHQVF